MRLLLKLEALKDAAYELSYYHKAQGFIYNLLRVSPYATIHNKKGYKFFCFSNIYPIGNFKLGDERNFLISSPDTAFIKLLEEKLKERKTINIGELSFKLKEVKPLKSKIKNKTKIITATPIIIRIPKRNYGSYGILSEKPYIFWQPKYSFEAFIKQLEENLFKKHNEFYNTKSKEFPIFEYYRFIKTAVNHVIINGVEYKFFGSIWEFIFTYLNEEQKKLLEFGIDCGFGERNTFGFGFVNVIIAE